MAVVYYILGGNTWIRCNDARSATVGPCPGTSARYLSGANVCQWFDIGCDSTSGNITSVSLGKLHDL